MSDVQSGKPASVDKDTQWPRLKNGFINGGTGVPPVIRHNTPARRRCHQIESPISCLEEAVSIVLNFTEESPIPEPHKRLIARIEKLCTETQKRLINSRSGDQPERLASLQARPPARTSRDRRVATPSIARPEIYPPKEGRASGVLCEDSAAPTLIPSPLIPISSCTDLGSPIKGGPGGESGDGPAASFSPAENGQLTTDSCAPALTGARGGSLEDGRADLEGRVPRTQGPATASPPTPPVLPQTTPLPKNTAKNIRCDNIRPNTPNSASAPNTPEADGGRFGDLAEGGARRPRPTSPIPNPSPPTSGSAPPKARKRRRSLYTLGSGRRAAPRTPT